jgi:hypothetical protein
MAPAMARKASRHWEHLSDEDLLKQRICDLDLRLNEGELPERIAELYYELRARDLLLRPVCYLADEWMTPNHQYTMGIPFYLAHPRLRALELSMMLEVEGGTPSWCMKLLRHETGHAIDHAFRLHARADWVRVFGNPRVRYAPELYIVDPHSKDFVRNLRNNYAQSHPEEDFAETFSVWLDPASQWRKRYRGWPALRKLRFVDRLMRELAGRKPPRRRLTFISAAKTMRATLGTYYRRKIRMYQLNDLSLALPVMKRIFGRANSAERLSAARFIRNHKRDLVEAVTRWAGERRGHVDRVVANLARVCEDNDLALRDEPDATLVRLSSYVATLIVNRLHTQRYRLRGP